MRHLFLCTRCQLQARLHIHLSSLQQARRGFSLSAASSQEQSTRDDPRIYPPQSGNGGRYSRPVYTSNNDAPLSPPRQSLAFSGHGRSSGQRLRPEAILNELDLPIRRRGGGNKRGSGTPANDRGRRYLPPPLYGKVSTFITLTADDRKSAAAWETLYSIASDGQASGDALGRLGSHNSFRKAYRSFVIRMSRYAVEEKPEELRDWTPPKPMDLLRLSRSFGIDASALWPGILWEVASALVDSRAAEPAGRSRGEQAQALRELMVLWNLSMAARLRRDGLPEVAGTSLDWSSLPIADTIAISLRQQHGNGARVSFQNTLAMLLPQSQINSRSSDVAHDEYTSAALVTLYMLRTNSSEDAQTELNNVYRPFANLLEAIFKALPRPTVPKALQRKLEASPVNSEYATIVERLELEPRQDHTSVGQQQDSVLPAIRSLRRGDGKGAPTRAADSQVLPDPVVTDPISPSMARLETSVETRDPVVDRFVNLRIRRLGQAMSRQNPGLAERIKQEILDFSSNPSRPRLPDQMYEHLMLTLLSLRNPKSAIEVWNHFIKLGREPTTKTYTVMMRGAQHVRDILGMEAFWNKMRDAGVQADVHAWTTRIFGLIRGGKVDAGLKALSELSHEWITAARKQQSSGSPKQQKRLQGPAELQLSEAAEKFDSDIDGVPRPSLVVMNATISALASRNDKLIPKVLAWGRQFGLEPDQTTYNVLLNLSLRHGQSDDAMGILKRMQERGIEASSTTWTILLTALFEGRSLDGLAPGEQQERIMDYITSLEAATTSGIDAKGYALIIDRLLKLYNNSTAAAAVLSHMVTRGLQPTPHIYTILMASYFQQQPNPDFAAAEALWNHIQASDAGRGAALDSVFYDRMIEGYATHHRITGTQPMLHFLDRMSKEGKRPSWRALDMAARALAERRDWDTLLKIVDEARQWVREGDGEVIVGERRFGQRDFWSFIISTGLLNDEGISRPEQLMRTSTGESPMVRRMGMDAEGDEH